MSLALHGGVVAVLLVIAGVRPLSPAIELTPIKVFDPPSSPPQSPPGPLGPGTQPGAGNTAKTETYGQRGHDAPPHSHSRAPVAQDPLADLTVSYDQPTGPDPGTLNGTAGSGAGTGLAGIGTGNGARYGRFGSGAGTLSIPRPSLARLPRPENPPVENPPVENPPVENPPVVNPPVDPGRAPCGPELHIFGVYETNSHPSTGHHSTGTGTVHVDRKGPIVIALSSYEPADWTVTVGPDTVLERVILNGYYDQHVVVPVDVPIDIYDGAGGWLGAGGYAWGGSDTPALVTAIEAAAKQKMTSFHGCYHATLFVLNDDLGVTTDCAVDQGDEVTGYVEPAALRCDLPPNANPCAHASGLGTYVGEYCDEGHPFIITHDISCQDALSTAPRNLVISTARDLS
jgi:hypothetical protein